MLILNIQNTIGSENGHMLQQAVFIYNSLKKQIQETMEDKSFARADEKENGFSNNSDLLDRYSQTQGQVIANLSYGLMLPITCTSHSGR